MVERFLMKRIVVGLVIVFLGVSHLYGEYFTSLQEAYDYATEHEEYPEIDNTDWLNPDFSTFLKQERPGFWSRLLMWVKIKRPAWSVLGFKHLIERIVNERELNGLTGNFVQKVSPLPGSKFLIWGDLHGAFHSLVRDLGFLQQQGIVNEDFKIINDNYYFVFNGNVVDRSPYSLEILTLVMQLMVVNQHRIFYIRGDHEDKQKWHSYGLGRELKIRARHLSREKIPLSRQLTRFFNTLPRGLYLNNGTKNKKVNVVRIAYPGRYFAELDESRFAGFLAELAGEKPELFRLDQKQETEKDVSIRALIRGEDRTTTYQKSKGLGLLEAERDATAWSVLSSPIGSHRRLYEFFFDSFAELTIQPKINEWTIAGFYQDVRQLLGFKQGTIFNLVSGRIIKTEEVAQVSPIAGIRQDIQEVKEKLEDLDKEVGQVKDELKELKEKDRVVKKEKPKPLKKKVSPEKAAPPKKAVYRPKELVFGSTLDLSKGVKIASERVKSGVHLRVEKLRQEGGIDGVDFKVIFRDDEYTPKKARANIEQFIKDGIDMTLCSLGSPTLEAYVDLIKEGKVLVLFPITGAPIFRDPKLRYIVHFRACYCAEARVLVEYAREKLKANKFVIFYQNDVFGRGALGGARSAVKKLNIGEENWIELAYERNDVNFAKQAQRIKQENPDAIIFLSTSIAAKGLIRQIGVGDLAGKTLCGLSDFAVNVFRKFAKQKGLEFIIASVVPNPETSELAIVKRFRKEAKKHNVQMDTFALEGYINTSILIDVIKKIIGPITKDAIIAEIEKIKKYDFEGLLLDFNQKSRELLGYIWLYTGGSHWERIVVTNDS